jgi:hypothetical protein
MRYRIDLEEDYPVYTLTAVGDGELGVEIPASLVTHYDTIKDGWEAVKGQLRSFEKKQEEDARVSRIREIKDQLEDLNSELKELEK